MVVSDPLRPNGTVLATWFQGTHTSVNENVTQPNPGNANYAVANEADNNEVFKLSFPNTIDDIDEATNITVWTEGMDNVTNHPTWHFAATVPL